MDSSGALDGVAERSSQRAFEPIYGVHPSSEAVRNPSHLEIDLSPDSQSDHQHPKMGPSLDPGLITHLGVFLPD